MLEDTEYLKWVEIWHEYSTPPTPIQEIYRTKLENLRAKNRKDAKCPVPKTPWEKHRTALGIAVSVHPHVESSFNYWTSDQDKDKYKKQIWAGVSEILFHHFKGTSSYTKKARKIFLEILVLCTMQDRLLHADKKVYLPYFIRRRFVTNSEDATVLLVHMNQEGWLERSLGLNNSRMTSKGVEYLQQFGQIQKKQDTLWKWCQSRDEQLVL